MSTRDKIIAAVYAVWAVAAIGLAFLAGGLSADNVTRLSIIAFLIVQLVGLRFLRGALSRVKPSARFIASGMLLAAVVEGLYMISRPVFPSLLVGPETDARTAIESYAIDLALTLPAYLVIFSVIWRFICRYRYTLWEYILVMAMGQTLGDGFVYFVGAPAMLLFLPYPMFNYHALNIVPFLLVRGELPASARSSRRSFLALPVLVVVYLACGAVIAAIGSLSELR